MNQVTKEGACGCQMFEFYGLPCRHLHHILVLRFYAEEIPSHFILKRWMKDANRAEVIDSNGLVLHAENVGTDAMRISHYCRRSTELAYLLGKSEEAYNVAMDLLNQAFEEVRQIDNVELQRENTDELHLESCGSVPITTMGDPRVTQAKGRPRDEKGKPSVAAGAGRYKSGLEKSQAKKKPRTCQTCNVVGHDSRNCGKRKALQLGIASKNAGFGWKEVCTT
ncbi:zinc finger protein [Macleaya cordata]|uniref:Protein FAR1-RELATED SEQUENCE n=1 Tax=Macleaya cordata TaxID=56857 RepID=A0A200QPW8_MACCD|nr:zinc finger protein [Macleaya cordata]